MKVFNETCFGLRIPLFFFLFFMCMNDTMVKSTVVSALNNAQLTGVLNLMITKTHEKPS